MGIDFLNDLSVSQAAIPVAVSRLAGFFILVQGVLLFLQKKNDIHKDIWADMSDVLLSGVIVFLFPDIIKFFELLVNSLAHVDAKHSSAILEYIKDSNTSNGEGEQDSGTAWWTQLAASFLLKSTGVAGGNSGTFLNTAPAESSGTSDVREMNTSTGANAAPETAEDHRRKAMLEDWGMEKKNASSEEGVQASMYRAVIHDTQQVKVGQTALFRTKELIRYNTVIVPANTLLSGVVAISQNRLSIMINSVRIDNGIFSLPLEVYGSDGIPGIPLNYDQIGHIANDQASTTTVQEISSAVSRYGGTLGRVAGSLVSGIGGQVRSAKNIEVKLIDNQSVILKIVRQ